MRDFSRALEGVLGQARRDLLLRRLFPCIAVGLGAALIVAAAAGSALLPFPAWLAAAACAVAGVAAGLAWSGAGRIDARRLLIEADLRLGTRELLGTGHELSGAGRATGLAAAVIEDATALLERTPPRAVLGRRRLPWMPLVPILACLTIAALLFPVDLTALFSRPSRTVDLVELGNELQDLGERLRADAEQTPGRSLALPQQLAQLGRDLSDRKVSPEEALDRISELESGLSQEYELRSQPGSSRSLQLGLGQPGSEGTRGGKGSDVTGKGEGTGDSSTDGTGQGKSAQSDRPRGRGLDDLGGAIDKLRDAKRGLAEGKGGGKGGGKGRRGGEKQPDFAQGPPGGRGDTDPGAATGTAPGDGGTGPDLAPGQQDQLGNGGPGTAPAPEKHGDPTAIQQGTGPGLQADGTPGPGDNTRLLARTLPEWSGSRLPEEQVIQGYARQAESALLHDAVPLSLRQAVRDYFTQIGIAGRTHGGAGTGGVGN